MHEEPYTRTYFYTYISYHIFYSIARTYFCFFDFWHFAQHNQIYLFYIRKNLCIVENCFGFGKHEFCQIIRFHGFMAIKQQTPPKAAMINHTPTVFLQPTVSERSEMP